MLTTGKGLAPAYGDEHGPAFELILLAVQSIQESIGMASPSAIVIVRHATIFIFFMVGAALLYKSMLEMSLGAGPAFFGLACYILHPRIFNHSYHNSYDIGFATACIVCFYALLQFRLGYSWRRVLAFGASVGFAVAIRAAGLMWLLFMPIGLLARLPSSQRPKILRIMLMVAAVAFVVAVGFWPFLWSNPFVRISWAVSEVAKMKWPGSVYYMGHFIPGVSLPWHYNFVWIAISTPIIVLMSAAIGISAYLRLMIARQTQAEMSFELFSIVILWLAIPCVLPIIFSSVLFDDWRHHYFVYPAIAILSATGFRFISSQLGQRSWGQRGIAVLWATSALGLFFAVRDIVLLHPYENTYFNSASNLVFGRQQGLDHRFDMDYWGLSYREGLDFLSKTTQGEVRIFGTDLPLKLNMAWLSPGDLARFKLSGKFEDADYFLSTYRWQKEEFGPSYGHEIYARFADGRKILTVRKIR